MFGSSALSSVCVQAGNHFIHLFLAHLVKISSLWEVPPLFGSEIEFRDRGLASLTTHSPSSTFPSDEKGRLFFLYLLTAVTFIDAVGKALLTLMAEHGAGLVAVGRRSCEWKGHEEAEGSLRGAKSQEPGARAVRAPAEGAEHQWHTSPLSTTASSATCARRPWWA